MAAIYLNEHTNIWDEKTIELHNYLRAINSKLIETILKIENFTESKTECADEIEKIKNSLNKEISIIDTELLTHYLEAPEIRYEESAAIKTTIQKAVSKYESNAEFMQIVHSRLSEEAKRRFKDLTGK